MKVKKMVRGLAILLIVMCTTVSMNSLTIQAGLKEMVRGTDTISDEINESVWHNANGDVTAEEGVIVFPNESIADTKLTIKTKAKVNEGVSEMATLSGTFKFTSLPQGEKFVIAFGLKSIEGEIGEAGNVEIAFMNQGGLNVSVTAYSEEGEASELMGAKKCGAMNNTAVKAILMADQTLTLYIGGTQVYNGKIPVSGEGRIGFLQTGSCGVRVSDINIKTYDYERPENCNIYEDFEDGEFNKNLLTSKMVYRRYDDWEPYLGLTEMDGNKVFLFQYTNLGYFGTKYKYSNFEMSFDVPHLQRSNVLDEKGNITLKTSSQMIVSFGGDAASHSGYGYDEAAERILFREINAIAVKSTGANVSVASKMPFFDSKYDKGISIKIRMVDNMCTIFMKWINDTEWIELLSYRLETPNGYIHIWGAGGPNYAIDNLKIDNLDANPNLIEVDYESSVIAIPADYDYQPTKKVYAKKEEEKKGNTIYWAVPIVAGACVLALGSTVLFVHIKNRKRKDGVGGEA